MLAEWRRYHCLRKQQSSPLMPPKSPSPGFGFASAGLSTARGEASCFIRLKCYQQINGSANGRTEK